MNQDDYYSNFARRVYFLADQENWPKEKIMRYFNDKPGFEKYYNNVSEVQTCFSCLVFCDSYQRD